MLFNNGLYTWFPNHSSPGTCRRTVSFDLETQAYQGVGANTSEFIPEQSQEITEACGLNHEMGFTLALHLNFEIPKRDKSPLSEKAELFGCVFLISLEISLGFLAIYTKEKYGLKSCHATCDIC